MTPSARWVWTQAGLGTALLAAGEALILAHHRPLSDDYFPLTWFGFFFLLDAAVLATNGTSLVRDRPRHVMAMIPMSAAFWWLFELFDQAVHNWSYVGAGRYSGLGYVVYASVDFSTVLLVVWSAARFIRALAPTSDSHAMVSGAASVDRPISGAASQRRVVVPLLERHWQGAANRTAPAWLPQAMFAAGIACVVLPVLWPRVFFGLIWLCLFFLLDPINYRFGRPSILAAICRREWVVPFSFALGGLMCGFFWEGWNYWAMPKWVYTIPYVGFWKIFEMPLLGWLGYLPFGLEIFAVTNFLFPLIRLDPLEFNGSAAMEPTSVRAGS